MFLGGVMSGIGISLKASGVGAPAGIALQLTGGAIGICLREKTRI